VYAGATHAESTAVASVTDADRLAKKVAPIIREIQSSGVASHRDVAQLLNLAAVYGSRW
jgi:hypothetical protein